MTTKKEKAGNDPKTTQPRIRKQWERHRTQTPGGGESVTDQSHAAQVDINNIVKLYHRTGQLPEVNKEHAQFADVSDLQGDLTENLIKSQETIDEFNREQREAQAAAQAQDRESKVTEKTPDVENRDNDQVASPGSEDPGGPGS